MTQQEMFGKAVWLSPGSTTDTPYIRSVFTAKKAAKAVITLCGLGFFELYINGARIGDDLYGTLSTYYHANPNAPAEAKYGETLGSRIYCTQYDVTEAVQDGQNAVGVALGPGWYTSVDRYGDVKTCWKIEFFDAAGALIETVVSQNGKWAQGPVVECSFFKGETQDASLEIEGWSLPDFDDSAWNDCMAAEMPQTQYFLADCPTDRVIRKIKPTLVAENDRFRLYDAGENITGYAVVDCKSKTPVTIDVHYGEEQGYTVFDGQDGYVEAGENAMDTSLPTDSLLDPRHTYGQVSSFRTES